MAKGYKKDGTKFIPPSQKGKKRSKETKLKLSISHRGKTNSEKQKSTAKKNWLGEDNPNWKGGITPINQFIRTSLEYKLWRTAVFERDNYTCIWGGKEHGNKLHADHIKPFALFPELRFAIDNGRTLCEKCHRATDTFGGKSKNKVL